MQAFESEARAALDGARSAFEAATAAEIERRNDLIEIRTRELQVTRSPSKGKYMRPF
jgi:hypothetical protein